MRGLQHMSQRPKRPYHRATFLRVRPLFFPCLVQEREVSKIQRRFKPADSLSSC